MLCCRLENHLHSCVRRRFIQETQLLLADAPSDINASNSRLEYIWQIGRNDLFDGMQLADSVSRGLGQDRTGNLKASYLGRLCLECSLCSVW